MQKVNVLKNRELSKNGPLIWAMLPELADTFADRLTDNRSSFADRWVEQQWIFNIDNMSKFRHDVLTPEKNWRIGSCCPRDHDRLALVHNTLRPRRNTLG